VGAKPFRQFRRNFLNERSGKLGYLSLNCVLLERLNSQRLETSEAIDAAILDLVHGGLTLTIRAEAVDENAADDGNLSRSPTGIALRRCGALVLDPKHAMR
jgi:hypothetical protein